MQVVNRTTALFSRLFNAGVDSSTNEKLFRQVRLINKLSIAIFLLTVSIGATFYALTLQVSILVPATIEAVLSICPLLFNRRKKYFAASLMTFLLQCVATLYFGMLLRTVLELQTVIFFLLLISFILFDQPIARRISCIVALLILLTLEANSYIRIIQPLELPVPYSIIFKTLSFGGLFCLILLVGYPYVISHDVNYHLKTSLRHEESNNNAKSVFIRHLSHEIQSHFLGIVKLAYSVRKVVPQENDAQVLASDLLEACLSYKQMLANLIEYTKIDAGVLEELNMEAIQIRELMNKNVHAHNYAAEKGVRIVLSVQDEMPEAILGDELRLTQVCHNLLTNAIKFTKPNTVVAVCVNKGTANWILTIRDEGDGISEEKLNAIFNPYVTDKSNAVNPEGIGLGLYVTKHIVENLLNGNIEAYNNNPSGATFRVTLPLIRMPSKKLSGQGLG
ncbi:MAG TPA: HAMP domain-containing sensor histidine kinase [Cyclobacteriaceae bacterium]|nr:HAMP domain-containing sensor histidine kinase [Cyclobacteriaceae bacterium]